MRNDVSRITKKWDRDIGCFQPQSVLTVKGSVRATRYLSFHYRLVMRILTTNSFLHIIHCRENSYVVAPETLLHLFVHCQHVHVFFWQEISQYLERHGLDQLNKFMIMRVCPQVDHGQVPKSVFRTHI